MKMLAKYLSILSVVFLLGISNVYAVVYNYSIGEYQADVYKPSSGKLGIIRLYDKTSSNIVRAYLHFYRSSSSFPADREYVDSSSRIHAHYHAGDYEEILSTLNSANSLRIQYINIGFSDTIHLVTSRSIGNGGGMPPFTMSLP